MAKWYIFWVAVFIGGVVAVLNLPQSSDGADATPVIVTPSFDADHAWQDLVYQVNAGYRVPGTAVHRQVRDWLVKDLSASASTVTLQAFNHSLGGRDIQMWNIIATISGTGKAPREHVLLAAHWDSRPTADKDPLIANRKLPIAGANDGASGVAVLLEIARELKAQPVERDVTIILVDGEDYGPGIDNMLLGARYYAKHLPEPEQKPDWGILLDMIGDKELTIYREPNSDTYATAVNNRIFRAAGELGYKCDGTKPGFVEKPYKYPITDDHIPLNEAGIPMVDLIDFDYPVWHTRADTADQCSKESLAMVGKTVLRVLQVP